MRHLLTIIWILLFTAASNGQNYELSDTRDQLIKWKGKAALGSYSPEGTLKVKSAYLTYDTDTISAFQIEIDMSSLYQENQQLAKHLRNKDFFHTKKYPVATFKATKKVVVNKNTVTLKGVMTIKNKGNTEHIPIVVNMVSNTLTLQFDFTINRTTYDIIYNSPSFFEKLKEDAIDDQFQIKGQISLTMMN